jgi:pimeloyl-ACP methyl ester carboxylesterase
MAAAVRSATVRANGLEFGLLAAGSGPLALCLHGFPDTAHTWRHLLPALAGAGFHAVAPFMRGYAPTAVPADGVYQLGALIADAVALHEALGGGGDAVLIGHDWGAEAAGQDDQPGDRRLGRRDAGATVPPRLWPATPIRPASIPGCPRSRSIAAVPCRPQRMVVTPAPRLPSAGHPGVRSEPEPAGRRPWSPPCRAPGGGAGAASRRRPLMANATTKQSPPLVVEPTTY